jgi:hypothetical protein
VLFIDPYGFDNWEWWWGFAKGLPGATWDTVKEQAQGTYEFWAQAAKGGIEWESFGEPQPGTGPWQARKYDGCTSMRVTQVILATALVAEVAIAGYAIGTGGPFLIKAGSRGGFELLLSSSLRVVTSGSRYNLVGIVVVGAGQVLHLGVHIIPGFTTAVFHLGTGTRHIPIFW